MSVIKGSVWQTLSYILYELGVSVKAGVGMVCLGVGEGPRAEDLSRSSQPDKPRKPFLPSGEETLHLPGLRQQMTGFKFLTSDALSLQYLAFVTVTAVESGYSQELECATVTKSP